MRQKDRGHNFLSGFGNKNLLKDFILGKSSESSSDLNISDKPSSYIIELRAPDFKKDELAVDVKAMELRITGIKDDNRKNENKINFKHIIDLPSTVEQKNIKVKYNKDTLQIFIPKKSRLNEDSMIN